MPSANSRERKKPAFCRESFYFLAIQLAVLLKEQHANDGFIIAVPKMCLNRTLGVLEVWSSQLNWSDENASKDAKYPR